MKGEVKISKSAETLKLEKSIYDLTVKLGTFGCYEVTIGWFGKERVDYMTYDTKGIFRCYEIKVSKSDFYSKAKHTFLGHYNYFVMPTELYEEVKQDIPDYVGVYNSNKSLKRAKKQDISDEQIQLLKDSIIRSLSRYLDKEIKCNDTNYMQNLQRKINRLQRERDNYYRQYIAIQNKMFEKYGRNWDDALELD